MCANSVDPDEINTGIKRVNDANKLYVLFWFYQSAIVGTH